MLKTEVLRNDNRITIKLIDGDKQFIMSDISGHDIHWYVEDEKNFEFEMTKKDSFIFEKFVDLYENILETNQYIDNSPVEEDKIKWYSDEPCVIYNGEPYQDKFEIADSFEIIKTEDLIKIRFNCATKKLNHRFQTNTACVRIRRSGSQYDDLFACYFNQHFYELLKSCEKTSELIPDKVLKKEFKIKRTE